MTSKLSRSAMIAALAVGACGLVAVPAAEAANGVSIGDSAQTATAAGPLNAAYAYVHQPTVTGASGVTPESAKLSAAIDTGGDPASSIVVPAGGSLSWAGGATVFNNVGTAPNALDGGSFYAQTTGGAEAVQIDGLPVSGSNTNIYVKITDNNGLGTSSLTSGKEGAVSNDGADNYSTVEFWVDPASDYTSNGDQPGGDTIYSSALDVPTTTGLSAVSTVIGGYPAANAEANGQTPLNPGTAYYYGVVQQAGATDAAEDVNIAAWVDDSLGAGATSSTSGWDANPKYSCLPDSVIAQDPTLASYTASTNVTTPDGVTVGDALQGPCIYYYGDTGGALYYYSPAGEFKTPKLGTVVFGANAKLSGKTATVSVDDMSVEAASGSVELTAKVKGKTVEVASGTFRAGANARGTMTLKLTAAGVKATTKTEKITEKVSKKVTKKITKKIIEKINTTVSYTSNTDQPSTTKHITL